MEDSSENKKQAIGFIFILFVICTMAFYNVSYYGIAITCITFFLFLMVGSKNTKRENVYQNYQNIIKDHPDLDHKNHDFKRICMNFTTIDGSNLEFYMDFQTKKFINQINVFGDRVILDSEISELVLYREIFIKNVINHIKSEKNKESGFGERIEINPEAIKNIYGFIKLSYLKNNNSYMINMIDLRPVVQEIKQTPTPTFARETRKTKNKKEAITVQENPQKNIQNALKFFNLPENLSQEDLDQAYENTKKSTQDENSILEIEKNKNILESWVKTIQCLRDFGISNS